MFAKLIEYQGDYEKAVKEHKEKDIQVKGFPRAANIQGGKWKQYIYIELDV